MVFAGGQIPKNMHGTPGGSTLPEPLVHHPPPFLEFPGGSVVVDYTLPLSEGSLKRLRLSRRSLIEGRHVDEELFHPRWEHMTLSFFPPLRACPGIGGSSRRCNR